ncbi:hypothetical protein VP1G_11300 [Cytospora mali]|uniref:Uncharacterized protein n=1 Tax=Cytospora mali TaxID=578113 RepID=A0A194VCP5_CYTMA|nr:hypothetical protein VP1G_11300 [Valsa mali var. pyri (nom. inval.)]
MTDIDSFKDRNHEHIQGGIPPAHDHPRQVRPWDVDWPEYAHQPIMLWHDRQPRWTRACDARTSPSFSVALVQICLIRANEGACKLVSALSRGDTGGRGAKGPRAGRTKSDSLAARRATGRKTTRKNSDNFVAGRIAPTTPATTTYNYSVVPGKYGKLIEPRNKVPSSGGVASYEDSDRKDGEGVHRIAVATLSAFRVDGAAVRSDFQGNRCSDARLEVHNVVVDVDFVVQFGAWMG